LQSVFELIEVHIFQFDPVRQPPRRLTMEI
jgi:hypothetical protein